MYARVCEPRDGDGQAVRSGRQAYGEATGERGEEKRLESQLELDYVRP